MNVKIDYRALAEANTKTAEFHVNLARQYFEAGNIQMGVYHRNLAARLIDTNWKVIAKMLEEGR